MSLYIYKIHFSVHLWVLPAVSCMQVPFFVPRILCIQQWFLSKSFQHILIDLRTEYKFSWDKCIITILNCIFFFSRKCCCLFSINIWEQKAGVLTFVAMLTSYNSLLALFCLVFPDKQLVAIWGYCICFMFSTKQCVHSHRSIVSVHLFWCKQRL